VKEMRYLNLDKMREGKFNSILKKEKSYIYEFEFKDLHFTSDHHVFGDKTLTDELLTWLKEVPTGNFKFIHESGMLWGVSFQKRSDALIYTMVWA